MQGATIKSTGAQGAQRDVGKYVFFDFENGWQQRVSDEIEMDLTQIENELIVQPTTLSGAPISGSTANPSLQQQRGVVNQQ